jgi:hypothetical protein
MQVLSKDYNIAHPELKSGEIFLTNIYTGDMPNIDDVPFHEFGFLTKRLGMSAYCTNGYRLPNHQPIFVKKWEYYSRIGIFWSVLTIIIGFVGYIIYLIF